MDKFLVLAIMQYYSCMGEKKCVVVCDDDEGILDVVKIVIEEKGYEVVLVPDSNELLTTVKDCHPVLIMVDLLMPGKGGESVIKQLKKDELTKDVPIVVVSGHKNTAEIATQIGADTYLEKPFEILALEEMVEKYSG